MTQSVSLDDKLMDVIREEAGLRGRSAAEQIAHWVELGRAIEYSVISYDAVRSSDPTMAGATRVLEDDAWLDEFVKMMATPSASEAAFFARRKMLGLGVGLDGDGNLISERGRDTP